MQSDRPAENTSQSGDAPVIELIKRADISGPRLGVFAASFNPPTVAHVELIRCATNAFPLDEVIALAGHANADKLEYECSLEDRLEMLRLTFASEPRVSIGVSSHAFYVDMIEAIGRDYPGQTDLHFIVGFDTFERVIDRQDRYTARYHRGFSDRISALHYLFIRSKFIVAARAGAGREAVEQLLEIEPAVPRDQILFLEFPDELGEVSATEVRRRRRIGEAISGLVPAQVEQYIQERNFYAV
ncbi:MAG TPA: nicotinate-nicotinamide nucleotide adenylyltransferase [Blastocatellia bacterium]|nr:nicotinate-nicotinamide nucleotide adenylyltransferase [Blastocatellia bacterium]